MHSNQKILNCYNLGRIDYQAGLDLQDVLHARRLAEEIGDCALFLEHDHVITLGKRGEAGDILVSQNELMTQGVAVHQSNRGGQVTYHGPGQLVVYLIFNLYEAQRELRRFVENLEQSVILYLDEAFGLKATVDPHHPGVWVGDKKIAALGISVRQRVTSHGLALNINTDLAKFNNIVPCGISDRGVTSLTELLGREQDFASVREGLAQRLARQYAFDGLIWLDAHRL